MLDLCLGIGIVLSPELKLVIWFVWEIDSGAIVARANVMESASHLSMLRLCPEDLCRGRSFPQELAQGVLLQAQVSDGPRSLTSLLAGVYKHQHLKYTQRITGIYERTNV